MKHSIPIQLRFNDTDALGHVNNSTYFSFYDLGKTEYFNSVRGTSCFKEKEFFIVAHAEVDFIEPVFLTNKIAVQTQVSHIGNKSFNLEQQIVDLETNHIKCKCKTVMVAYDVENGVAIPIPQTWREAVSKYEDRPDFLIKE